MKFIIIKQDIRFCVYISSACESHVATSYSARDKNVGHIITKSFIGNKTAHKASFGYKVYFELKKKKALNI